MFKQIITAVVLSGIVMSSSYAETRRFTLTPEYTKTTNYQTKSIGMAALDKQIKLPAYVVYQEDPVGEHVGTLIKNHPTSMTIKHTLDKKYANELAMYYFSAADRWIMIPKNWRLVTANVGANGSESITFLPPQGQKGYFQFWTNNGGCVGCGVNVASLFFKDADQLAQEDYESESSYHNSVPQIKSVQIRPHTQAWRTTVNGQNIDGVAYFNPEAEYYTYTVEISLPKSQNHLATPVLNWFLPEK